MKKAQTVINDLYLRIKTKNKIIIDKIMFVIKSINWNEEDKKQKKDRKNANILFILIFILS